MSAAEPPQSANSAPSGGSEAAKPRAWGGHTSAAEPPQSANSAPSGGSEAAKPRAWGGHTSAQRTGEPLLAVTHLVKHYALRSGLFGTGRGVVHAVDDVSFTIGEGETLGLVGESGCGKSTIARTVLGLTAPTAGAITWRGERIDRLPAATMRPYRQALQAVFQDPYASLNPRMRAADIVAEPIRNFETASAGDIGARVLSLFQRVGLRADQMPRYPYEFSGGQRQRLGIARALAPRPQLIVCDEPVSALDVSVQAQVINLLADLQHEFGLSYLFVAHDLAVVEHISHRVAVMYLGRLVELTTTRALFDRPLHPYTEALLAAVPVPDPTVRRKRAILAGDVPSPTELPSGCRFHTRCPHAFDRCRVDDPALVEAAPQHFVACHLREPVAMPPSPVSH